MNNKKYVRERERRLLEKQVTGTEQERERETLFRETSDGERARERERRLFEK